MYGPRVRLPLVAGLKRCGRESSVIELSYGTARKVSKMYYPNARRLTAADSKEYFLKVVKPKLPDPKAMPNDGEDTVFRFVFSSASLALLSRNIRVMVMRAF